MPRLDCTDAHADLDLGCRTSTNCIKAIFVCCSSCFGGEIRKMFTWYPLLSGAITITVTWSDVLNHIKWMLSDHRITWEACFKCGPDIWKQFVCIVVLRPSQPNGVMQSVVSLPNHTFTGRLSSLRGQNCAYSFARNWQLPFLNQQKERMTTENISWSITMKECWWPGGGVEPATFWSPIRRASNWATRDG